MLSPEPDYDDPDERIEMDPNVALAKTREEFLATPIDAETVSDLPPASAEHLSWGGSGDGWERHNNYIRATWAGRGVTSYAERVGLVLEEPETAIGDLLSDLMHLCDALAQTQSMTRSFDDLLDASRRRYREELNGEP